MGEKMKFKNIIDKIFIPDPESSNFKPPVYRLISGLVLLLLSFLIYKFLYNSSIALNRSLKLALIFLFAFPCAMLLFFSFWDLFNVSLNRSDILSNIFGYNPNLTSFKPPVCKLLICVVILILHMANPFVNIPTIKYIIRFICGIISILCIYRIAISICEIYNIAEKKLESKRHWDTSDVKNIKIDKILRMVMENDIIEFEIFLKEVVKIGSSSDYDKVSDKFFDKEFYIGEEVFTDIHEFQNALNKYSANGLSLPIVTIDGVRTVKKSKRKSKKQIK